MVYFPCFCWLFIVCIFELLLLVCPWFFCIFSCVITQLVKELSFCRTQLLLEIFWLWRTSSCRLSCCHVILLFITAYSRLSCVCAVIIVTVSTTGLYWAADLIRAALLDVASLTSSSSSTQSQLTVTHRRPTPSRLSSGLKRLVVAVVLTLNLAQFNRGKIESFAMNCSVLSFLILLLWLLFVTTIQLVVTRLLSSGSK